MPLYKTEAITLARKDLREADKVITLYSPDRGKFYAVAKGIKRSRSKMAAAMEPFTYSKLLLATGKQMDIITQAQIIESFYHLREDLNKTACATYMVELVDKLVEEGEPNPVLFNLLLSILYRLQRLNQLELLTRLFELQIIKILGYMPSLDECVICGKPPEGKIFQFSVSSGGVLCSSCAAKQEGTLSISKDTLQLMRMLLKSWEIKVEDIKLSDEVAKELKVLTRAYLNYYLPGRLKSVNFLSQMKKLKLRKQ